MGFEIASRYLRQKSPQELQDEYPLAWLLDQTRRPSFMVDKRDRLRPVAEEVLLGATYEDLKNSGWSVNDLSASRTILSEYGLVIPYNNPDYGKQQLITELAGLKEADPREKKQQVLERIDFTFMNHHTEQFKTFCTIVSALAWEANLHFVARKGGFKLILQALEQANIDYYFTTKEVRSGSQKGIRHTYFIWAGDTKRAVEVLEKDARLEPLRHNPVRQISGIDIPLPSTYDLQRPGHYGSVLNLCRRLRIKTGGRGKRLAEEFFIGNLAPVFEYEFVNKKSFFYPLTAEKLLAQFLLRKIDS